MDGTYPVYDGNRKAGDICLETKGLYCYYRCVCIMPKDRIYRVKALVGGNWINLGVCIPRGEHWECSGKFPGRLIASGELRFQVVCGEDSSQFYPLDPHLPFEQIARLDGCVFSIQDQKAGLIME